MEQSLAGMQLRATSSTYHMPRPRLEVELAARSSCRLSLADLQRSGRVETCAASIAVGVGFVAGISSWKASCRRVAAHARIARLAAAEDKEDLEQAALDLEALEAELEALEELEEAEKEMMQEVDDIISKGPEARSSSVTASRGAASSSDSGALDSVFVFGANGGVGAEVKERLSLAGARTEVLQDACRRSFEELDEILSDCKALVVAPDIEDVETLPVAKEALKALLASCGDGLTKVVLVSSADCRKDKGGFNVGSFFNQADDGFGIADLEDELTATARKRTGNRPLYTIIVRAGSTQTEASGEVQCWAGDGTDENVAASKQLVAEAVFQALDLEVDAGFSVAGTLDAGANWPELMTPFIGPEVWRRDVPDAKRAAFFVQGWADEFFGVGKSAMRMGVKTPVRLQETPSGVIFKFAPLGTAADTPYEELQEGGVEFLAEEPAGKPPRLRARRCGYGWKVSVKENSERALLQKFSSDWKKAFPE